MKRIFLFILTFIIHWTTFGQIISLKEDQSVLQLGGKVSIVVDSTSSLTTEEALRKKPNVFIDQEIPNLALTNFTWWVKFNVRNDSRHHAFVLNFNQPILNDAVFYHFENGRIIDSFVAGESKEFNSRKVKLTTPAFLFYLKDTVSNEILIKIKSNATLILDLQLGKSADVHELNHTKDIMLSLYYGIVFVIFLYNLFVFFSVKESIYKFYVIYMSVLFVLQITLDGFGYKYIWPDSVWLSKHSFFLFTSLVNITGIEFARRFIHSKEYAPLLDKFHYVIYVAYIGLCILSLNEHRFLSYQIILPLAGISALYMLALGIIIARRNYRPARFFLYAWIPLIIGITISVLKGFNILAHNYFTNYSIQIGTAIEIVLLSLALADKINEYKKEKEQSQLAELQLVKEKEELVRNQKGELEKQVKERTEELNKTLENLKNTQTQLVESEKMSSLGQLTAGLAHEINNPVNFISSTISPLRRDVKEILYIIDQYDELLKNNPGNLELTSIENYKKKVDYEYIKEEMSMLFDAIYDGSQRTAEIVKGLKSFSRIDELDLKYADIHEGIDSTLMLLKNQISGHIKVIKQYGDLPLVECYPGKLNQVFMNIISNSVYILNKNKVFNASLTITTTYDKQSAFISIKDNGPGIPAEVQEKIFEPFYTTKPVGEGTGLGLSIVFSIIETHKGNISVNSEVNDGAEFVIQIPLKQE